MEHTCASALLTTVNDMDRSPACSKRMCRTHVVFPKIPGTKMAAVESDDRTIVFLEAVLTALVTHSAR